MRPRERESCRTVLRQSEFDGVKSLQGVAILAAIVVRRSAELAFMHIDVASGALHGRNLENSIHAFRQMAFGTRHLFVLPLERILRRCVHRHGEK
jgi:hypothetical protein